MKFKVTGSKVVLAVRLSGRAVVTWDSQNSTADGIFSPLQVFAAVRTNTNARFGVAHMLDAGPPSTGFYGDLDDVAASIGANGFTTVVWSSEQDNLDPPEAESVRAMVVDPSGDFQPVQELAGQGTALTLTETPEGGTLLQWEENRVKLNQAVRLPGSESFGPPQAAMSNARLIDGARLIESTTGE